MAIKLVAVLLLSTSLLQCTVVSFICPPAGTIVPCKCSAWHDPATDPQVDLVCESEEVNETSLAVAMRSLVNYGNQTNQSLIVIDNLHLVQTAIKRLDSELTFDGLLFKNVDLASNLNLTYVRPQVFGSSRLTLRTLSITNSPIGSNSGHLDQLFDGLKDLVNLESLLLNENDLKVIPLGAFNSANGTKLLANLTLLDLSRNLIETIEPLAFKSLGRLNRLTLDNNQLTLIKNSTFTIVELDQVTFEEDNSLIVSLRNNNLTAASFEPLAFDGIKRTYVTIYLSSNQIDTLPEVIFRPFLDKNDTTLALWQNAFKCDCRLQWLLDGSAQYLHRVHGITCPDDREIWDYATNELGAC